MNLPKLRRRTAPAVATRDHEHRLAWRLGALTLDYPKARTTAPSSEPDSAATESTGAPR